MTTDRKISLSLSTVNYSAMCILLATFVTFLQGCVAAKPACMVINLADMVCETISVQVRDPVTGKVETVQVKKSALTGAVKAAAAQEQKLWEKDFRRKRRTRSLSWEEKLLPM